MNGNTETKVAIVTGASSGIGAATAVALARRGFVVVLAARREDRLHQVARCCAEAAGRTDVESVTCVRVTDVAHEDQVNALVAETHERLGRIDVMVNNAGHGVFARVHETTDREMRAIFDVNYFGVFYGCKAVAPVMIAQGRGHIFNVSSVIGHRGTPFQGAYCATKFALRGLTDAMRVELAPHGVWVTSVCPALTRTEFSEQTRHRQVPSKTRSRLRRMPAEQVGRAIALAVGRRKAEMVFTGGGKFLAAANCLAPGLVDRLMAPYHAELVRNLADHQEAGAAGEHDDAHPPVSGA